MHVRTPGKGGIYQIMYYALYLCSEESCILVFDITSVLAMPSTSVHLKLVTISGGGVNHQEREVTLTLKHGVEAKNYDDVSTFPTYLARTIMASVGAIIIFRI